MSNSVSFPPTAASSYNVDSNEANRNPQIYRSKEFSTDAATSVYSEPFIEEEANSCKLVKQSTDLSGSNVQFNEAYEEQGGWNYSSTVTEDDEVDRSVVEDQCFQDFSSSHRLFSFSGQNFDTHESNYQIYCPSNAENSEEYGSSLISRNLAHYKSSTSVFDDNFSKKDNYSLQNQVELSHSSPQDTQRSDETINANHCNLPLSTEVNNPVVVPFCGSPQRRDFQNSFAAEQRNLPSAFQTDASSQADMNFRAMYPNQAVANTLPLQSYPAYNFYDGNIRSLPVVKGKQNFPQGNRENPAIKFHIRTITHCEVECPTSGAIPFAGQPSQYFINDLNAPQNQQLNKQHQVQAYNCSQPQGKRVDSNYSMPCFQSGFQQPSSFNVNANRQENKGEPEQSKFSELTTDQQNENITQDIGPAQSGYINDLPSEPRQLLVHERRTSIVIGNPLNYNETTSNGINLNSTSAVPAPPNVTLPAKLKKDLPHDDVQFNDESEQLNSCYEPGNKNIEEAQMTTDFSSSISNVDVGNLNSGYNAATTLRDKVCKESERLSFDHPTASMRTIPNQVEMHTSYTPVVGVPPHPFTYFPPTPAWITSKQTFTAFPTSEGLIDYLPISPSLPYNNDSHSIGFIPNVQKFGNGQRQNFNNVSKEDVTTISEFWSSSNYAQKSPEKLCQTQQKKTRANTRSYNKQNIENKKFICKENDCTKRFVKERDLEVHVNKHHLHLVKPYFCSYCAKSFKRPDQLKRHEKIHTGEKPHHCQICGRPFARTDHRNTHYKKHNGIEKINKKYSSSGELLVTDTKKQILNQEGGGKFDTGEDIHSSKIGGDPIPRNEENPGAGHQVLWQQQYPLQYNSNHYS